MLAWNHGEFIRQAIESILNQESDFSYEVVIGEDCSSDDTQAICQQYQARFPQQVRLLASETNLGMHKNFARLWSEARGDYIAFCEGDDYWCDPHKLSKQVTFLEQFPECTLCGTYTEIESLNSAGEWERGGLIKPGVIRETYTFEELIPAYNFHFSSVMLKKDAVHFPPWFQEVYCVDRPLYLLAAQQGKAGLIAEVTSVYRVHDGGNWSSIAMEKKAAGSIALFTRMRDYFDRRYAKSFDRTLGGILWFYMSEDLNNQQIPAARKLFWKSVRYSSLKTIMLRPLLYAKVLVRLYIPFKKAD